jgi:formylglycine-generating enzyme required for sulfatase activity
MKTQSQMIRLGLWALALCAGAATGLAADRVTDIGLVPRLTIEGTVGVTHQIQYCTDVGQPNWTVLTNVLVAQTNYGFVDLSAPLAPKRFYRVVVASPQGMVMIPAGSFSMGDCLDADDNALPQHPVYVSAFFMDRYLVTKGLWDTVKAWNGGNGYAYDNPGSGKAATHPVQTVTWYDVVKWCNARSEMESRTPCYYTDTNLTVVYKTGQAYPSVKWTANGYRLPTEAEWEKAARGGAGGHRFPWSDTETITHSRANYFSSVAYAFDTSPTRDYHPTFNDGVYPYTSPVGYFAANAYGLFDMTGNVWQWCWDWFGQYSVVSQTDPHGPASGFWRELRGGGWNSDSFRCRTASRYSFFPTYSDNSLGFRCVLVPGQ